MIRTFPRQRLILAQRVSSSNLLINQVASLSSHILLISVNGERGEQATERERLDQHLYFIKLHVDSKSCEDVQRNGECKFNRV